MNIEQAMQEIIHTVRIYARCDENGVPEIPPERQRPILLMGPPGIGKTAIMEQVAQQCGINLVSYTITHHTRQSAIGLPFISKKNYGGKEYSVTEYTMSEIIASVYEQIELSGVREGILFLDEINCVSETLAPTMLQFLQYKTFGTHRVPDGFIIVTAGNPPQYNASVRDFDIVTLDRVKRIDIEADFGTWKKYALKNGVHGAVLAYLEIKKEHFYSVRTDVEGKYFVTARGWEDLSRMMIACEKEGIRIDANLCVQYLQDREIAERFATYYELWNKYSTVYHVSAILAGEQPDESAKKNLRQAPFDEKLSLITMLTERLNGIFHEYAQALSLQQTLQRELSAVLRPETAGTEGESAGGSKRETEEPSADGSKRETEESSADGSKRETEEPAADGDTEERKTASGNEGKRASGGIAGSIENRKISLQKETERLSRARMLDREEEITRRGVIRALGELASQMVTAERGDGTGQLLFAGSGADKTADEKTIVPETESVSSGSGTERGREFVRAWFAARESARQEHILEADTALTNSFRFLAEVFGEGQEMVLFLTGLTAGYYSLKFVTEQGNEAYYRYNRLLLLDDRRETLKQEILRLG